MTGGASSEGGESPRECDRCGTIGAREIEGSEHDYLCRVCFEEEIRNG